MHTYEIFNVFKIYLKLLIINIQDFCVNSHAS